MKVREIMTGDADACEATATLADAAAIMWQRDCGVVPIVGAEKKVIGMITDRDICMSVWMQNRQASSIKIGEIMSGKIVVCRADDEAESVLKKMKKRQLRRLPVVDENNVLLGVVSLSDFLRSAGKGKNKIAPKKLLIALREISSHRPVQLHEVTAEKVNEPQPAAVAETPSENARQPKLDNQESQKPTDSAEQSALMIDAPFNANSVEADDDINDALQHKVEDAGIY